MSPAAWRTRRLVVKRAIGRSASDPRFPRRPQAREILARVMGGARERRGGDHEEALGEGDRLVSLELLGCNEAHHWMMPSGRLEILADGEEIDLRGAQVVHHLEHFVPFLAEPDHD